MYRVKCHISASLVYLSHGDEIKVDEDEIMSLSSECFPFYRTSIFPILQPPGSGYHKTKVNELPDWDWRDVLQYERSELHEDRWKLSLWAV